MKRRVLLLLFLLSIVCLLWFFVVDEDTVQDDFGLRVTFLDIGQGDATLIDFADGTQMLIDCAIDARIIEALGRHMHFSDRIIDYLVVTHPDLDHYGGCEEVLRRFDVGTIIYNGEQKHGELFDSFWTAIQGYDYVELDRREVWTIASTTIDFLYPDHAIGDDASVPGFDKETGSNNTSVVMKLSYGETDVLLTADAEEELEEYLVEEYGGELDVEILKAGHHGSQTSSIDSFVSSTSPTDVVVSCGYENKFKHPSRRVLKRFERASSTVWRTDVQGDVVLEVGRDGEYFFSVQK